MRGGPRGVEALVGDPWRVVAGGWRAQRIGTEEVRKPVKAQGTEPLSEPPGLLAAHSSLLTCVWHSLELPVTCWSI